MKTYQLFMALLVLIVIACLSDVQGQIQGQNVKSSRQNCHYDQMGQYTCSSNTSVNTLPKYLGQPNFMGYYPYYIGYHPGNYNGGYYQGHYNYPTFPTSSFIVTPGTESSGGGFGINWLAF